MIKFYYTTSEGFDMSQTKISNSLGGFKSSTEVPNDCFSNIFGEISLLSGKENKPQYIALILKNEGDEVLNNVELWFTSSEDNLGKLEVGAVVPNKDNEDNSYIERTTTMYSKPFGINFHSPTEEDKVTIGNLEPNQEIGLWFKRSVDVKKFKEIYDNVAIKDLSTRNRYKPIEKSTEELIDLHISWD